MASPQIEDGYTRIANELIAALCSCDLSGGRLRLMLHVMRETYGYRRTSAAMTYGDIAKAVKMQRQHVMREMKWLAEHQYLGRMRDGDDQDTYTWSVQKDYTLWGATNLGSSDEAESATKIGTATKIGATKAGITSATNFGSPPTPPYMEERNLKKDPPPRARTERQKPLGLRPFKPPPDETHLNHPAVQAAITTLKREPTATQQALIADTVTDLPSWQGVLRLWVANNYNLDRIGDMLDRYGKDMARPPTRNGRPNAPPPGPPIPALEPTMTRAELHEQAARTPKRLPGKPEL